MMPRLPTPPITDLQRAFTSLDSAEIMVLKLRAGLVDGHRHSLREVGAFLGATRAEARSLEWQSWQKLEQLAREDQDSRAAVTYLLKRCAGRNAGRRTLS